MSIPGEESYDNSQRKILLKKFLKEEVMVYPIKRLAHIKKITKNGRIIKAVSSSDVRNQACTEFCRQDRLEGEIANEGQYMIRRHHSKHFAYSMGASTIGQ